MISVQMIVSLRIFCAKARGRSSLNHTRRKFSIVYSITAFSRRSIFLKAQSSGNCVVIGKCFSLPLFR